MRDEDAGSVTEEPAGGAAEDEQDDDAEDDGEEDADDASVQSGSTNRTAPTEVGLSTADVATVTRTLSLLESHPTLLDHPSMRSVRTALAPLVERLASKWQSGLSNATLTNLKRRALGFMAKDSKNSKASAQRLYEQALDSAARNATGMRAARLQKLESLNTMLDSEAQDEETMARRASLKAYRVPDGVAITDGTDDVCLRLTDGGGKRQKLLLTNGSAEASGAASTAAASSSAAAAAVAPSASSASAAPLSAKLINPVKCYICKSMYKDLHHFYDSLCPACAKLNFSKRSLAADLTGKIILLTGARVKIGYRILTKLLRCGAFVVATTRFPHDLSQRLQLEKDFASYSHRVHIYGLDFRNLTVLEQFVAMMYEKYTHLDAIINNACQTVRRPPAYYTHLMDGERIAFTDLSVKAQAMLQHHHAFAEGQHNNLLQADGAMRRLESGSGVDVEVPAIKDGSAPSSSAAAARPSAASLQPPAMQFRRPAGSSITIVEEGAEDDAMVEEIVAAAAATPKKTPAAASSSKAADKPPASNPRFKRAVSEPVAGASSSVAAPAAAAAAATKPAAGSKKRSRRAAMRSQADEASSQALTFVPAGGAGSGAQFTTPSALAAESTQLSLLASDEMSAEERAKLFPVGVRDVNGQQLDLRATNSWTMKLADVPIGEAAEVMAVNCLAPFLLNSKLKDLMIRGNENKAVPRFIVNVSAMEGKFYRYKSASVNNTAPHTESRAKSCADCVDSLCCVFAALPLCRVSSNHPHTNAAKAALNMMTRTSAQDYVDSMIFMTAVDTGWINVSHE